MEIRFFRTNETKELQQGIHDIWGKNHVFVREEKLLKYMFLNNPSRNTFVNENYYSFLGAWKDDTLIGLLGVMPFVLNIYGGKKPFDGSACLSLASQGALFIGVGIGNLQSMENLHKV